MHWGVSGFKGIEKEIEEGGSSGADESSFCLNKVIVRESSCTVCEADDSLLSNVRVL